MPLYAAGARMTEMFPILPLAQGQAASVALASYDGGVYFGVNGDWDAMRDVALLAELLEESLAELVAATATGAVGAAGDAPGARTVRTPTGAARTSRPSDPS